MKRRIRPGRQMSFSDRVGRRVDDLVGIFSPKARFHRLEARLATDAKVWGSRFSYEGADSDHRLEGWLSGGGSADAELDEATHETLRDRSNERMRNTGLANTVINSVQENVVGQGLEPTLDLDAVRLGISASQASELRDQAKELWDEWSPHADSTNRLYMQDIQALVLASVLVNGDVGVMPLQVGDKSRAPSPLGLKLELIESDRIATPYGEVSDDGRQVRNGVSLGKYGQPLGYWVSQGHPGDSDIHSMNREFRRIRAHNPDGSARFLHLYWMKRIGQSRGEPLFAPVLAAFKDLGDWVESELVKSQIASCFAMAVTRHNPYDAAVAMAGGKQTPSGKRAEEIIPGQIFYGQPGETVQGVSPNSPNSEFGNFFSAVARQICSVSGMPLEVAMRDFSKTTYSQARAALLEARRSFANRQTWLVRYLMRPVHDRVLYEGWLRGRFDAGDFLQRRHLWTATTWGTPGWGHIDEEKSMKASKLALEMRVTTRNQIARALNGRSFAEVNRELAREEDEIRAVGGDPAMEPDTEPETVVPDETEPEETENNQETENVEEE